MRRLSRFSRPLNALFALWFAMVLGDPGVLHSCPMHGGHRSADAAPAAATAGHGGHASHTLAAADAGAPDAAHHGDTPAPCTCVGHCCAAPAAAPVSPVTALAVPEAVARAHPALTAPPSDMADLATLHRTYASRGVRVLAISVDAGDGTRVRRFVEAEKLPFAVAHDPAGVVQQRFQAVGVPETYLISADGRLLWVQRGGLHGAPAAVRATLDSVARGLKR